MEEDDIEINNKPSMNEVRSTILHLLQEINLSFGRSFIATFILDLIYNETPFNEASRIVFEKLNDMVDEDKIIFLLNNLLFYFIDNTHQSRSSFNQLISNDDTANQTEPQKYDEPSSQETDDDLPLSIHFELMERRSSGDVGKNNISESYKDNDSVVDTETLEGSKQDDFVEQNKTKKITKKKTKSPSRRKKSNTRKTTKKQIDNGETYIIQLNSDIDVNSVSNISTSPEFDTNVRQSNNNNQEYEVIINKDPRLKARQLRSNTETLQSTKSHSSQQKLNLDNQKVITEENSILESTIKLPFSQILVDNKNDSNDFNDDNDKNFDDSYDVSDYEIFSDDDNDSSPEDTKLVLNFDKRDMLKKLLNWNDKPSNGLSEVNNNNGSYEVNNDDIDDLTEVDNDDINDLSNQSFNDDPTIIESTEPLPKVFRIPIPPRNIPKPTDMDHQSNKTNSKMKIKNEAIPQSSSLFIQENFQMKNIIKTIPQSSSLFVKDNYDQIPIKMELSSDVLNLTKFQLSSGSLEKSKTADPVIIEANKTTNTKKIPEIIKSNQTTNSTEIPELINSNQNNNHKPEVSNQHHKESTNKIAKNKIQNPSGISKSKHPNVNTIHLISSPSSKVEIKTKVSNNNKNQIAIKPGTPSDSITELEPKIEESIKVYSSSKNLKSSTIKVKDEETILKGTDKKRSPSSPSQRRNEIYSLPPISKSNSIWGEVSLQEEISRRKSIPDNKDIHQSDENRKNEIRKSLRNQAAKNSASPPRGYYNNKIRVRCWNWPYCRHRNNCRFIHPIEDCRNSNCSNPKNCIFLHVNDHKLLRNIEYEGDNNYYDSIKLIYYNNRSISRSRSRSPKRRITISNDDYNSMVRPIISRSRSRSPKRRITISNDDDYNYQQEQLKLRSGNASPAPSANNGRKNFERCSTSKNDMQAPLQKSRSGSPRTRTTIPHDDDYNYQQQEQLKLKYGNSSSATSTPNGIKNFERATPRYLFKDDMLISIPSPKATNMRRRGEREKEEWKDPHSTKYDHHLESYKPRRRDRSHSPTGGYQSYRPVYETSDRSRHTSNDSSHRQNSIEINSRDRSSSNSDQHKSDFRPLHNTWKIEKPKVKAEIKKQETILVQTFSDDDSLVELSNLSASSHTGGNYEIDNDSLNKEKKIVSATVKHSEPDIQSIDHEKEVNAPTVVKILKPAKAVKYPESENCISSRLEEECKTGKAEIKNQERILVRPSSDDHFLAELSNLTPSYTTENYKWDNQSDSIENKVSPHTAVKILKPFNGVKDSELQNGISSGLEAESKIVKAKIKKQKKIWVHPSSNDQPLVEVSNLTASQTVEKNKPTKKSLNKEKTVVTTTVNHPRLDSKSSGHETMVNAPPVKILNSADDSQHSDPKNCILMESEEITESKNNSNNQTRKSSSIIKNNHLNAGSISKANIGIPSKIKTTTINKSGSIKENLTDISKFAMKSSSSTSTLKVILPKEPRLLRNRSDFSDESLSPSTRSSNSLFSPNDVTREKSLSHSPNSRSTFDFKINSNNRGPVNNLNPLGKRIDSIPLTTRPKNLPRYDQNSSSRRHEYDHWESTTPAPLNDYSNLKVKTPTDIKKSEEISIKGTHTRHFNKAVLDHDDLFNNKTFSKSDHNPNDDAYNHSSSSGDLESHIHIGESHASLGPQYVDRWSPSNDQNLDDRFQCYNTDYNDSSRPNPLSLRIDKRTNDNNNSNSDYYSSKISRRDSRDYSTKKRRISIDRDPVHGSGYEYDPPSSRSYTTRPEKKNGLFGRIGKPSDRRRYRH